MLPFTSVGPCLTVIALPPPLLEPTRPPVADGNTSAPSVARSAAERPFILPGHGSHELEGHAYSETIAPGVFSSGAIEQRRVAVTERSDVAEPELAKGILLPVLDEARGRETRSGSGRDETSQRPHRGNFRCASAVGVACDERFRWSWWALLRS